MEALVEKLTEYVDRPLSVEETKILYDNYLSYFHEEMEELMEKHIHIFLEDVID
jgi:hypothetical protein